MYGRILIATDGSDLSNRAVRQGLELSRALQAQVTVITVTEPWATAAARLQQAMGIVCLANAHAGQLLSDDAQGVIATLSTPSR